MSEVVKVAEAYPGPQSDRFSDLLVVWHADEPVAGVHSASLGEFVGSMVDRSGNHAGGGWFTMAGPSILPSTQARDAAMVDFAPTIAGLLGVDLPGVDGRPANAAHRSPTT